MTNLSMSRQTLIVECLQCCCENVRTLWLVIHLGPLSRQTFYCRDKFYVGFTGPFLLIVMKKFWISRQTFFTFYLVLCCDKLWKCRDKLSAAFSRILLNICCDKFGACRDKVQLTPFHNYRDISFGCRDILSFFCLVFCRVNHCYVTTYFQCFFKSSSQLLLRHSFNFF